MISLLIKRSAERDLRRLPGIYQIDDAAQAATIVRVKHRLEVYR